MFTLAEYGTVRYGTIRYGTVRVYIPKNMRRLRGLAMAARTNHVWFNVAMPIDACSSTEYSCVRCLLYIV